MKKLKIYSTLLVLILSVGILVLISINNAIGKEIKNTNSEKKHNEHDGHNHAEIETIKEDDHENHQGHEHAESENEKEEDNKENNHSDEDDHESHQGHDHAENETEKDEDHNDHDQSGHQKDDKDEHAGHDHDSEGLIVLTDEQKKEIGLTIKKAGAGNLNKELTLTGEVVLNEDQVVHLVPRVSGIVIKVNKSLGDQVEKGEVLAVLDSAELGEAKSDYFEKFNNAGCCLVDLERARILETNTRTLIDDLKAFPSLDELCKKDYGDMGQYRSKLLASYADFLNSKKNYQRTKGLHQKKVVSDAEYESKRNDFEKIQAGFFSKLHEARFAIKQNLFEKEREQQVKQFKLKTAERKLRIFGLSNAQIKELKNEITKTSKAKHTDCKNKNCKNCQAGKNQHNVSLDENDNFSEFNIISPEKGTIIAKHISRGEKLDDETEIFTIADLSTVWVDLQVPARDIPLITKNSKVIIESTYGLKAEGQIKLLAPTINEETRTVIARIVLANPNGEWKTGSFVTGHIRLSAKNIPLIIPRHAVQNVNGKNVVFIPEGKGFEALPVKTGRSDRTQAEIVSGLKPGMSYVSKGAFELKAIKITSNLDSHAGHGH